MISSIDITPQLDFHLSSFLLYLPRPLFLCSTRYTTHELQLTGAYSSCWCSTIHSFSRNLPTSIHSGTLCLFFSSHPSPSLFLSFLRTTLLAPRFHHLCLSQVHSCYPCLWLRSLILSYSHSSRSVGSRACWWESWGWTSSFVSGMLVFVMKAMMGLRHFLSMSVQLSSFDGPRNSNRWSSKILSYSSNSYPHKIGQIKM